MSDNTARKEDFEMSGGETTETLVVVSKVKKLIRDRSGLNTSQEAVDALTAMVAVACGRAIEKAKEGGRKTVMGRDFSEQ